MVTETIFGLPGFGQLTILAVQQRDYTLIQGVVLVVAAGYVAGSMPWGYWLVPGFPHQGTRTKGGGHIRGPHRLRPHRRPPRPPGPAPRSPPAAAPGRAATWKTVEVSSPAILYMLGILISRPCAVVHVVVPAPV